MISNTLKHPYVFFVIYVASVISRRISEVCRLVVFSLFSGCFVCFVANWKPFIVAFCFNNQLCTCCVTKQSSKKTRNPSLPHFKCWRKKVFTALPKHNLHSFLCVDPAEPLPQIQGAANNIQYFYLFWYLDQQSPGPNQPAPRARICNTGWVLILSKGLKCVSIQKKHKAAWLFEFDTSKEMMKHFLT